MNIINSLSSNLHVYCIPLLMSFFAGLATVLGGFITFIIKKDSLRSLSLGLGFSAGVMIFLSFTEIKTGAEELLIKFFPNNYMWFVYGGFILGVIIAFFIDYFIPDHIEEDELFNDENVSEYDKHRHIKRAGLMTAIALAVHNFPEGMATFFVSTQDLTLGLSVAIAIGLHNIPEGIAVALPIYHATGKKRTAILYALLSGLSEPVGAVIGVMLLQLLLPQMFVGVLFAMVSGIMVYISFDTLLPLSHKYGDWHLTIIGVMSGIIFIWPTLMLVG
ncbi:MAG: zinc transporter ZupT [Candidatus Gastranaerophilales bacterium]|nr:zinc transporter ZupT [Candidatus Gastranaerophilales bacterium]